MRLWHASTFYQLLTPDPSLLPPTKLRNINKHLSTLLPQPIHRQRHRITLTKQKPKQLPTLLLHGRPRPQIVSGTAKITLQSCILPRRLRRIEHLGLGEWDFTAAARGREAICFIIVIHDGDGSGGIGPFVYERWDIGFDDLDGIGFFGEGFDGGDCGFGPVGFFWGGVLGFGAADGFGFAEFVVAAVAVDGEAFSSFGHEE
mmetsp:Transcript_13137/g.21398  ORF Transcript_13137/g.21398 Transcript_13137/m.21398 type:complete len:202 (-) Transcript_13137:199-804(-)